MNIKRPDNSYIKKRKINLNNLDKYDENKIKQATQFLENVINKSYVSHFDNISFLLNQDNNTLKELKNSGCINECKVLKKQLKKIGLKTYYISCQANGFSNPAGDSLVKEAHVFLLYPSIKNNKIYFTIFDPGFRMTKPVSFFDKKDSANFDYANGLVKVNFIGKNSNYPYELTSNKRFDYKHQIKDANIHWNFNPYYQTLNIDEFGEKLYHAMFSLKLMNFPTDINQYLCIRAKILDKELEIYTTTKNEILSFEYLSKLDLKKLKDIFQEYFFNAKLDSKKLNIFVNNLYLLLHNVEKYICEIIYSKVIEDYKLGNKLNR